MSQRHPGARRTINESKSDPDDAFLARVLEISKWAQGNQQALTVMAVVGVIVITSRSPSTTPKAPRQTWPRSWTASAGRRSRARLASFWVNCISPVVSRSRRWPF
jgi:hypothetical protein